MPRAQKKRPADNGHGDAGFVERVGQLNEGAQHLLDEAKSTFEDLGEAVNIRGRVRRHPYGMVAAALGAGFVLGGGLFSPLTFRLLGLGVRLAALPLIKSQLVGFAEAAVSGFTEGDDDVSSPS